MSGEELDLAALRAAFARADDDGDRGDCPDDGDRGDCPDDGEIWDAVHGELAPNRLREIVEHVAGCAACAESWRIALQLDRRNDAAGSGDADGRAGVSSNSLPAAARRRPRSWLYGGAAAAVAAAIVAAVVVARQPGGGGGTAALPGAVREPVLRGGAAVDLATPRWTMPDVPLPRQAARLRWSGPPGASYDLTVIGATAGAGSQPTSPGPSTTPGPPPLALPASPTPPIVAVQGLTATSYTLPPAGLAGLPAGSRLHAGLTAHLADGRSVTIFRDLRLQ